MTSAEQSRTPLIVTGVLCVAGLLYLYGIFPYAYGHSMHMTSVFGALWVMWSKFPDFQHGMIVPVLSALVVYLRRKELAEIPVTGWWPGIIPTALSLSIFWIGYRVDNQYLGFFSLQALLPSIVLWLLGWRWLKALFFPLIFLVFTWPVPFLDNVITFPLRMLMSSISVGVMNFLGIAVVRHGTGILSAGNPMLGLSPGELFRVDVADPCSGIRSLFALMMVSAIYGFFALKSPWKRMVLFVLSIPLAILGNLARILVLTLGTMTVGPDFAIGTLENPTWFHTGAGFAVFLVALSGMLLAAKLLDSDPTLLRDRWRSISRERVTTRKSSHPATPATDIY
jgi:eight transmembrane protein EpsH (proposed exosortase)